MAEFDIIARYFSALGAVREDVPLGVGDDAAVLDPPPGCALRIAAVTLDIHRPGAAATPGSLALNAVHDTVSALRDGSAEPAWATLALTLERPDPAWLELFAAALDGALRGEGVALVGGDTTRGPGTFTLAVIGLERRAGRAAAP